MRGELSENSELHAVFWPIFAVFTCFSSLLITVGMFVLKVLKIYIKTIKSLKIPNC